MVILVLRAEWLICFSVVITGIVRIVIVYKPGQQLGMYSTYTTSCVYITYSGHSRLHSSGTMDDHPTFCCYCRCIPTNIWTVVADDSVPGRLCSASLLFIAWIAYRYCYKPERYRWTWNTIWQWNTGHKLIL